MTKDGEIGCLECDGVGKITEFEPVYEGDFEDPVMIRTETGWIQEERITTYNCQGCYGSGMLNVATNAGFQPKNSPFSNLSWKLTLS